MASPDPKAIAAAYGGEARGDRVLVPSLGHSSRDRGTAIKVSPSAPDGVMVHCFNGEDPLAFKDDMRAKGLLPPRETSRRQEQQPNWKLVETYEYDDGEGQTVYRAKRYEDASWKPAAGEKRPKNFKVDRYEDGRWLPGLGDGERVPYRLTELRKAIGDNKTIYFVEGERKADKLIGLGLPATSIPFGSKSWRDEYAEHFRNARVCILPDNDEPGRTFAAQVFRNLEGVSAWPFVLELPDLPPAGDVVDWNGNAAELEKLTNAAFQNGEPEWLGATFEEQTSAGEDLGLEAKPFRWPDPTSLPVRRWLFGHWLLRGEVTTVIAPGGVGKTSLTNVIALALASGRDLLNIGLYEGAQGVWIYNIEDDLTELERQITAGTLHHNIFQAECADRLHLNSGLTDEPPLCIAHEIRGDLVIAEPIMEALRKQIELRRVSTLIVDPFVSSHAVDENANSLIDKIAKRWKKLAHDTNIAIVLVHHTRKSGSREIGVEDSRGGKALIDAARIALVLNRMSDDEAEAFGITDSQERKLLFRVDSGKSSRAPPDAAVWIKLQSQSLNNGREGKPSDEVGVATLWQKPDAFNGLSVRHLYELQQRILTGNFRENVQAADWIGHVVADITGLDASAEKGRIKTLIKGWKDSGAIRVETRADPKGNQRPFVAVGKAVSATDIGANPHLEK